MGEASPLWVLCSELFFHTLPLYSLLTPFSLSCEVLTACGNGSSDETRTNRDIYNAYKDIMAEVLAKIQRLLFTHLGISRSSSQWTASRETEDCSTRRPVARCQSLCYSCPTDLFMCYRFGSQYRGVLYWLDFTRVHDTYLTELLCSLFTGRFQTLRKSDNVKRMREYGR